MVRQANNLHRERQSRGALRVLQRRSNEAIYTNWQYTSELVLRLDLLHEPHDEVALVAFRVQTKLISVRLHGNRRHSRWQIEKVVQAGVRERGWTDIISIVSDLDVCFLFIGRAMTARKSEAYYA